MTNNLAEQTVKSYVINRKNFLFSDTEKGADASAAVMSITWFRRTQINKWTRSSDIFRKPHASLLYSISPSRWNFETREKFWNTMWLRCFSAFCNLRTLRNQVLLRQPKGTILTVMAILRIFWLFCPNGDGILQMNSLNLLCRGVNHCLIFADRNMMK